MERPDVMVGEVYFDFSDGQYQLYITDRLLILVM